MLVLTRSFDESIIINGNIEIKIIHIGKGKVKLGITAPKEVSVNRAEIEERIRLENSQGS